MYTTAKTSVTLGFSFNHFLLNMSMYQIILDVPSLSIVSKVTKETTEQ